MLVDLGLAPGQVTNKTAVKAKLEEVDKTFDLVMITERFPESLVLMKHLLCWQYSDLTSLKLNSFEVKSKSVVSDRAREALKHLLWPDYLLYDHFVDRFQEQLAHLAEQVDVRGDLEHLAAENARVSDLCVKEERVSNHKLKGIYKWYGGGSVLGFKIKEGEGEKCNLFGISELAFVNLYREKQKKRMLEAKMEIGTGEYKPPGQS